MDKNKQPSDDRPLIKKLALPLTLLVGGLLIVMILYKFLLGGKISLPMGDSAQGQDAFQAPAEISTSLQIECQASVDKIDKLDNCAEKQSEFDAKSASCASYSYALENPKSLDSDGSYSDIVFNIASCYKKSGNDKVPQAIALLKKAQEELPAWEVNFGPISCDSKSTLSAYLDSYSADSAFTCTKSTDLEKVVAQLQSKDLSVLSHMVWSQHVPQLGLRDSDVSCPETLKEISKSLDKALSQSVKVGVNGEQKADTTTTFIEINKGTDLVALLKVATNPDGCLYLDSLLVSNLDGVE
ncbi:hypothetical protein CIK05_00460 [Bdellovibrio sp. qaytius]|nr:hypothetical protein CIK05_00460 [Bdellovibrio sp. qaytius]